MDAEFDTVTPRRTNLMPQWLAGLLAGVSAAVIGQWAQAFFRRTQYIDEKLLEKYSELVSISSEELNRANGIASGIVLFNKDVESHIETLAKLEDQRHQVRRELAKLAFQIRPFEKDRELSQKVAELAMSQPFQQYLVPPRMHQDNYDERFEMFQSEIRTFERILEKIISLVVKRYVVSPLALDDPNPDAHN